MNASRILAIGICIFAFSSSSFASPRLRSVAETVARRAHVRLAAGNNHTCLVLEDATVRCWGQNGEGQLGDSTTQDRNSPVAVAGLTNVVAVGAGGARTCALTSAGNVFCWGQRVTFPVPGLDIKPVIVAGINNAVAIAVGDNSSCALLAGGTVS
jgi:alpha-tubulin suppressor-like RCC1 family protein